MNVSGEAISLQDWRENTADTLRSEARMRECDPLAATIADYTAQLREADQARQIPCIEPNVTMADIRETRASAEKKAARLTTGLVSLRNLLFTTEQNIAGASRSMLGKSVVHNPSKAEYMAYEMDTEMTAAVLARCSWKKKSYLHTAMKVADVAAEEYDRNPINPRPDYILRGERRTYR